MAKTFCDKCGTEILRDYVSKRLLCKKGDFIVEIIPYSTRPCSVLCRVCLLDIVFTGEEF